MFGRTDIILSKLQHNIVQTHLWEYRLNAPILMLAHATCHMTYMDRQTHIRIYTELAPFIQLQQMFPQVSIGKTLHHHHVLVERAEPIIITLTGSTQLAILQLQSTGSGCVAHHSRFAAS